MPVAAAAPLAGKLLPFLQGIVSNPAMAARITGAAAGGLPSLLQGNIPGAVVGGGFGALSTLGLGNLGQRFARPAAVGAADLARGLGVAGPNLGLVAGVTRAAIPVGIGLGANAILGRGERNLANQALNVGGGVANRVLGTGSTIVGYDVNGEPVISAGPAVPPGLGQFGGTNMYGSSPYDVLDPSGAMAASRLMSRKQAEVTRDNINTIVPTQLKWTEETKRRDLERQLAAAGIRQNIITQAQMLRDAQQAGLNQGTTALQQVGSALTNNYSYS
tara:strand:+ start:61 stop:885 length:825 start_codon:yes stop_codon:yes gene_type:complete